MNFKDLEEVNLEEYLDTGNVTSQGIPELKLKIDNINRGILALEFDVLNEELNAPYLKQMYSTKRDYERELKELTK